MMRRREFSFRSIVNLWYNITMAIHRVIIRLNDGDSIHTRFHRRIDAEVFKRAVEALIQPHTNLILDIHRLNVTVPQMVPVGERPAGRDTHWCPWCRAWRRFFPWNSYWLCEVCHIDDYDFYTRRANHWIENKTYG